MTDSVRILGIETSCDETSASVLQVDEPAGARRIRLESNVIASQAALHGRFGGVVPEVASRRHVETIIPAIDQALRDAGIGLGDVTAVAATRGPGLVGAILVGLAAAKAIAAARRLPFVGINHVEAHMYANFIEHPDLEPPFVCLVVSGGHTDLVHLASHGRYEVMGRTRDDAAGEAFDKVARILGLGYPGGPALDECARRGDRTAIRFPRAFLEDGSLDFSFSGLKTAVAQHVARARARASAEGRPLDATEIANVAASFQEAVVDVLVAKTLDAAREKRVRTVALAGGVAANSRLRQEMAGRALDQGLRFVTPSPVLCTDNAAMVACAGYFHLTRGETSPLDLPAVPDLGLD